MRERKKERGECPKRERRLREGEKGRKEGKMEWSHKRKFLAVDFC